MVLVMPCTIPIHIRKTVYIDTVSRSLTMFKCTPLCNVPGTLKPVNHPAFLGDVILVLGGHQTCYLPWNELFEMF